MLNVPMPQVELDRARILVRIGQLIPTRMPELVRMHWKAQGSPYSQKTQTPFSFSIYRLTITRSTS
jgi:hypothetical protein